MVEKGKSTDGLMRHIRNSHGVEINGSTEKQALLNMGYYHGYKASRYIKKSSNLQNYNNFQEVKAIYDFDIEVKTIFYPLLVRIETSLKNRLIDYLVKDNNSDMESIYQNKLNDYEAKPVGNKEYKKYLNKKLELRNKIDSTIAYNYSKGHPCIQHFFHSSKPLPLWAYFEVITMGEFGNFISCMNISYRIEFTQDMNMHHTGFNQNGRMLENIIFCLTGIRNATMHNSMIFDCRFNNSNFSSQLIKYLENSTGIKNIDFESIVDFLVLLIFLMKKQYTTKTELSRVVSQFDKKRELLYASIPMKAYSEILGTDARKKIAGLKEYISND